MKKVLCFLLMLALFACDKSDDNAVTPSDQPTCVSTEDYLFLISPFGHFELKNINSYDPKTKQLTNKQIHVKENNGNWFLEGYWVYTYNDKRLLIREDYHQANGNLFKQNAFEYDVNGLRIKATELELRDGQMVPQLIYTYEYTSPTQLKKMVKQRLGSQWAYDYTFEYENGVMTKIFFYDRTYGESTTILKYDDKKKVSTPISGGLSHEMNYHIGYPHKHNIKEFATSDMFNVLTEYYTQTFEYNSEGYPTEITSQQGFGKTITTFDYQCK